MAFCYNKKNNTVESQKIKMIYLEGEKNFFSKEELKNMLVNSIVSAIDENLKKSVPVKRYIMNLIEKELLYTLDIDDIKKQLEKFTISNGIVRYENFDKDLKFSCSVTNESKLIISEICIDKIEHIPFANTTSTSICNSLYVTEEFTERSHIYNNLHNGIEIERIVNNDVYRRSPHNLSYVESNTGPLNLTYLPGDISTLDGVEASVHDKRAYDLKLQGQKKLFERISNPGGLSYEQYILSKKISESYNSKGCTRYMNSSQKDVLCLLKRRKKSKFI